MAVPEDRPAAYCPGCDDDVVTHLVIAMRGHRYQLSVSEEKVLLRGDLEERRRASGAYRNQLYTYVRTERVKPYDCEATGILSIELVASRPVRERRPALWRDRKSWTLEDKLLELPYELELRAVEDDEREAEERRQQEERRRRWEQMMECPAIDTVRHTVPRCCANRPRPAAKLGSCRSTSPT